MASSTSLAAAAQAYVDEDYASAEEHYSAALAEAKPGDGGGDAELLAGRAAARLALEDFLGAADDARRAVAASPGLAKAHMRRGIALFHLEEFESSRDALNRAVELFQEQEKGAAAGKGGKSSGNGGSGGGGSGGGGSGSGGSGASARKWLQRAEAALAAEEKEKEKEKEAEERGVAVAAARAPAPAPAAAGKEALPRATLPSPPPPPPQTQRQQQQQPPPPQQPPPRFRHQWFQTSDAVEVGVLAKGLKQEAVRVQVEPRRLLVVIDGDDGESPSSASGSAAPAASAASSPSPPAPRFALDLALAGEVVPEKCRHAVLSTKVEVRLHKAAPGLAWPSLERKGGEGAADAAGAAPPPAPLAPAPAAATAAADGSSSAPSPVDTKKKPSYPSSNPKHTDWDELDRKLEEEEKRAEEEEGGEGGGGGPEQGEEALLKLFRSVYSGGDDDVRRAMSKSFVESGGEVLSTSWRDVSAGRMPGDGEDEDEGRCDKGCGGGGSCGHRH